MKKDIICGEAVAKLIDQMRSEGAPEQAITQMLSMLLEMSTRMLYRQDIHVHDHALSCVTPRGLFELPFPKRPHQA